MSGEAKKCSSRHNIPATFILKLGILAILGLSGCKEVLKNPEVKDPIYLDLVQEATHFNEEYAKCKATIEQKHKELRAAKPHTIEVKQIRKDLQKEKARVNHLRQMGEYYDIRSRRRIVEARRSYHLALKEGRDWPNPEEWKNYQLNKKMRTASLNWGARVPKLHDRLKKRSPSTKMDSNADH